MMKKQFCTILTTFGVITLQSTGEALSRCYFAAESTPLSPPPSDLLAKAARQLHEYFSGVRYGFDLPLAPQGTPFQQAVWHLLRQIPRGKTRSYGELAAELNNPGAARAVGMACHVNPVAVIIPCHRVIGSGENLGGFAAGLELKRKLLILEGALPLVMHPFCQGRHYVKGRKKLTFFV